MKSLLLLLLSLLSLGCMEMDPFLYNTEKLDHYTLPGNMIADSLIEPVMLTSGGNALYAYFVRSNGARPGVTILYCHGNADNIDKYWDRVMMLHTLGVNVLIFDYRGYGMSEGESSEQGLHEDGESALAYLHSRADVNGDSICYYGFSLGCVPAIYLSAEKEPPLRLFLEAPFASANSITQSGTALDLPPRWLTDGTYDNVAEIRKNKAPLLLFDSEDDTFIRYRDNGKLIFDAAAEPKKVMLVPGADHDEIPETMGLEAYLAAMAGWI